MKIMYFTHCSILGGANRSMLGLIDCNLKFDVEYIVIMPVDGPLCQELKKRKIKYYIFPYYNWVYYHDQRKRGREIVKFVINKMIAHKIAKVIKYENVDIVHTNDSLTYVGALAAKLAGVKHIWHIREFLDEDYDLHYMYPMNMVKKMYSSSDAIVAISQIVKKKIEYTIGCRNSILIYNGLDCKKILNTGKCKKFTVSFSGGDSVNKGILDVIDAFEIIFKNRRDIYLRIGGKFSNLELLSKLQKIDLDSRHVEILGESENWMGELAKSHISLVCSKKEAFGRVTIESMLCRAIVIASNAGANIELINNGQNGYIYSGGDGKALASIICYVKDNYEHLNDIIDNSYNMAVSNFDIEITGKKIRTLYRELVKER